MYPCTLIVTTTFGLEKVARLELEDLGMKNLSVTDGKIEFASMLEEIPRLNLWLRSADRVFIKLAEYKAVDFDELFNQAETIDWSEWIKKDNKITVIASVSRSAINSERTTQSMIKKVIVEQLKTKYNTKWLEEKGEEITIKVSILKDTVQLLLDTTGIGLHKRGYRKYSGDAPIRENLAAALILLSYWNKERVLIDPMCGSGTIAIEAALIGRNIAPGLNRTFASEQWTKIPKSAWKRAREDAKAVMSAKSALSIYASDIDPVRIKEARANAQQASVADTIQFSQADVCDLDLNHEHGILISNPPYGVKIGDTKSIAKIYSSLSRIFKNRPDWSVYVITADKTFPQAFKREKPNRTRKLYNGNLEVNYYQYQGTRPKR